MQLIVYNYLLCVMLDGKLCLLAYLGMQIAMTCCVQYYCRRRFKCCP